MAFARNFKKPVNANVEQAIKRQICDWLTYRRGKVYMYPAFRSGPDGKVYSSRYMPPGVPDLLVSWRGWFVAIEVKRPAAVQKTMLGAKKQAKGVLSEHQRRELDAITKAGGKAFVAYSLEDVIRELKDLPPRTDAPETSAKASPVNPLAPNEAEPEDPRQTRLEDFLTPEKESDR